MIHDQSGRVPEGAEDLRTGVERESCTPRRMISYFVRLGLLGFGGPVALANSMRHDLVEKRAWLEEHEYDEGLAIATACPGPLAYQLAWISTDDHLPKRDGDCWPGYAGLGRGIARSYHDPARDR